MSDSGGSAGGDGDEDEVYCICRSSDSSRFMIACDRCEEWYHGDCISVTERDAKYIKRFYCDRCRRRDPDLKIKYKESHKNRRHGEEKAKDKAEKGDKHERADKVEKKEKAEKSDKLERHEKHEKKSRDELDHKREKEAKKAARAEKERLRAEKEQARAEKERARAEKEKERARAEKAEKEREAEREREAAAAAAAVVQQRPRPPRGCGLCVGCLRDSDCGRCSTCRGAPHRPCKRRLCSGPPPQPQPSPLRESNRPPSPPREPTPPPPPPPRRKSTETRRAPAAGRRRKRAELSDDEADLLESSSRQCYGPQCVKPSRPGSRYCSDQCGLNLARNRIFQVGATRYTSSPADGLWLW